MNSPYNTQNRELTIEEGCPWYEAQQTYGAPNVNWCEPTTCSYFSEPANTWSNLGYLIVALALFQKLKTKPLSTFPIVVFVMGFLSLTYHATNNFFSQYFDFVGMFLMMGFLLSYNSRRLFAPNVNFFALYWFYVFLNSVIFVSFDITDLPVQLIMMINTIPIVIMDLSAGYKEGRLRSYKYFFLSLSFLIIAQSFSILDIKRIWCEPSNTFLHGHVMWHIFSALGMWFIGLHMRDMNKSS